MFQYYLSYYLRLAFFHIQDVIVACRHAMRYGYHRFKAPPPAHVTEQYQESFWCWWRWRGAAAKIRDARGLQQHVDVCDHHILEHMAPFSSKTLG